MRLIALLVLAGSWSGCVGTRTFSAREAPFLQARLIGQSITLTRCDGITQDGVVVRLDADSVAWRDASTQGLRVLPLTRIASLREHQSRPPGAGTGRGMVVGAAAGALVGAAALQTDDCGLACPAVGLVGGLAGAALGGIAGGIVGYAVADAPPARLVPAVAGYACSSAAAPATP